MLASLLEQMDGWPIWQIALLLLVLLTAGFFGGRLLHIGLTSRHKKVRRNAGFEGFVVSAVLGLLALLLGFTFSLATQRFEERRQLVVADANAIGTAYLRVQLLDPPHRERLSDLIRSHLENELDRANAGFPTTGPLIAQDNEVLTQIWAATLAALDSPRETPFAFVLTAAMNNMIDLDASRKAAHLARVPSRVFAILWIYLLSAAILLGYEVGKGGGTLVACLVLLLMTAAFLLILDIDRPGAGRIRESQEPMEQLRDSFKTQPPAVFDRWRSPTPTP